MPKNPISIQTLPYHQTGYFSKLMSDYLAETEELKEFYGNFPKLDNFSQQLKQKRESFDPSSRERLVSALKHQYMGLDTSEETKANIDSLIDENTFTITTGHQLNLFTGPLYFLYKIISVINLAEQLAEKYSDLNFVPMYWMATEDHDFDEINYFNLFGKKIEWDREDGGAVGEMATDGLSELLKKVRSELGNSSKANELCDLFSEAYVKHDNLADATRYLGNALFSNYGLVIIDGNDASLKEAFVAFAEKEITDKQSFKFISETSTRLKEKGYPEQVFPREINLFYLDAGLRERILEKDGKFLVNNTELEFTQEEFLKLIRNTPERISPNALLRPLYQEVVLPNLCYVGGGGELAYWFQLKVYFESVSIPFPILLLRNSALLLPEKYFAKLSKLNTPIEALFQSPHGLEEEFTHKHSKIEIDFSTQKEFLQKQFETLHDLAKKTDASFEGAVAAQEKKQLNGLDHLEKRLMKAQKRRHLDELERLTSIQETLFPKQTLQERTTNFSEFYLEYGSDLILKLKDNLDPLGNEFSILRL